MPYLIHRRFSNLKHRDGTLPPSGAEDERSGLSHSGRGVAKRSVTRAFAPAATGPHRQAAVFRPAESPPATRGRDRSARAKWFGELGSRPSGSKDAVGSASIPRAIASRRGLVPDAPRTLTARGHAGWGIRLDRVCRRACGELQRAPDPGDPTQSPTDRCRLAGEREDVHVRPSVVRVGGNGPPGRVVQR